jgi:hypothetical protein
MKHQRCDSLSLSRNLAIQTVQVAESEDSLIYEHTFAADLDQAQK